MQKRQLVVLIRRSESWSRLFKMFQTRLKKSQIHLSLFQSQQVELLLLPLPLFPQQMDCAQDSQILKLMLKMQEFRLIRPPRPCGP